MDWLTFIAEIVKAIAWPVAVVLLARIFRPELANLLRGLKKGKIGPAEFEFERTVKELESTAPDLAWTPAETDRPIEYVRLAATHPRAAILEAWVRLEDRAIEFALSKGLTNPSARRHPQGAFAGIRSSGILSKRHLDVLDELRELRNEAAHDPDFNPPYDAVVTYVYLAENLLREFDEIRKAE